MISCSRVRLTIVLLMCVALVSSVHAQRRRSLTEEPEQPARIAATDLPSDLARLFPGNTIVYTELSNVAPLLKQPKLFEAFQKVGLVIGKRQFSQLATDKAMTPDELRAILSARLAFGIFELEAQKKQPNEKVDTEEIHVAVVSFATPEAAAKLRERLLNFVEPGMAKLPRRRALKVSGLEGHLHSGSESNRSFAYATLGRHLIAGNYAGVTTALARADLPPKGSLAEAPGFATAARRLSSNRQMLAFFNLAVMEESQRRRQDLYYADDSRASEALRRVFYGREAMRSLTIAAEVDGEVVRAQASVGVDREKHGLVPLFLDPPSIGFRAAKFAPPQTDVFFSFGMDIPRFYDFLRADKTPQGAQFLSLASREQLEEIEQTFTLVHSLSLRNDILGAFGNELAVGIGLSPIRPAPKTPGEPEPVGEFYVGIFEVRQPETLRALLAQMKDYFPGSESQITPTSFEYKGVECWQIGPCSWAVVDGYGIGGRRKAVEMAIDAYQSGSNLTINPTYTAGAAYVPRDVASALFLSPEALGRLLGAFFDVNQGIDTTGILGADSGLFVYAQKDENGIFISGETSVIGNLGSLANAADRQGVVLDNERAALDMLEKIADAQARYTSTNGRFGTFEELVKAGGDAQWKNGFESRGYRFSLEVKPEAGTPGKYELIAVPASYGKTGFVSLFRASSGSVLGADHRGAPATGSDPSYWSYAYPRSEDAGQFEIEELMPLLPVIAFLGSPTVHEVNAASVLTLLTRAQARYKTQSGRYATVEELAERGFLSKDWKEGFVYEGYRFSLRLVPGETGFEATAVPISYGRSGKRSFYVDASGQIRAGDKAGAPATADDPLMSP